MVAQPWKYKSAISQILTACKIKIGYNTKLGFPKKKGVGSQVVSIPVCHTGGPGSIPGRRILNILSIYFLIYFVMVRIMILNEFLKNLI